MERDADGRPEVTRFLIPCQSADREGLGREAGAAMASGVDLGDLVLAEKAADLGLSVNDPKAEES